MRTLREVIADSEARHVGIGHFNIAEMAAFEAIAKAVRETKLPVFIGTAEKEREFIGAEQAVALVKSLREEGLEVFLNADHHKSLESIKAAVEAGYDSVLFDAGALSLEENIIKTREVVQYVKSVNPNITVEGEMGNIGSGSEVRAAIPEGAQVKKEDLTRPEDAARFVKETGVDFLAPAVGNFHGMVTGGTHKEINIEQIKKIKAAVGIPLVLHGGSGSRDEDFKAAILAGMNIVHVSTELRVALRQGLEESFQKMPNDVAPYKLDALAVDKIYAIVKQRLLLFAGR